MASFTLQRLSQFISQNHFFSRVKYGCVALGFIAQSRYLSLPRTTGFTGVISAAHLPSLVLPFAVSSNGDCDKRAFNCMY